MSAAADLLLFFPPFLKRAGLAEKCAGVCVRIERRIGLEVLVLARDGSQLRRGNREGRRITGVDCRRSKARGRAEDERIMAVRRVFC